MGTQQILLIVLSVIIVGVAIAVGIQMFNAQFYSMNKTSVAADAQVYATQVIQYYKTPSSLGGAGNSIPDTDGEDSLRPISNFLGWGDEGVTTNENGSFKLEVVESGANGVVKITGVGNAVRGIGDDQKNPVVETTIEFPACTISAAVTDETAMGGGRFSWLF